MKINSRKYLEKTINLAATTEQLEWWFVQGFIESSKVERQHFMLSFFRQASMQDDPDGFMLLTASLSSNREAHSVASKVSPQLVENFNQDAPNEVKDSELDQAVAGAILNEIAKGGPPRPIELATSEADISSCPHAIDWEGFEFRQDKNAIEFSFQLPGTDKICQLRAEPQVAWFEGRNLGGERTGTMAYDCCPQMDLDGLLDGEHISGKAWMDHQWGGYGWIIAPHGESTTLGWDWFGINLDDGRDLIVIVHRDMRNLEPIAQYAVVFNGTEQRRIIEDLTVTATRIWRNPSTMIDYPISCTIEIPELDASIEFEPLADNQEIPVFGMIGAIWEGAGKVSGSVAGKAVSGRARLELHGYGYVGEFEVYQKKWVERIDQTITGFLPYKLNQHHLTSYLGKPRWAYDQDAQSKMFSEPVWDLMSRGGKHWRPVFGLLLLEALGTDPQPYELMLSTIPEMIHNGSVIIDDIEDSSTTRRGEETVHLRYDLPTAINAGNTLYFLPLLTVAENSDLTVEQQNSIYKTTIDMFVRAHFGQAQDLYWGQLATSDSIRTLSDSRTRQLVMQAHAFKSAAAVKGITEIVCTIANADEVTQKSCVNLAESWGVAFQIVDDVNNFSTSKRWGKFRGEDVYEGKVTYVTHNAVQMLASAEKDRLLEIMSTRDLRQSESGLAEAIGLIEQSGALEASRKDAEDLYTADWPEMSQHLPNSQSKFMLRAMMDKLLGGPFEM